MKKLNTEIVKRLSEKLDVSEKTVRNNVYSLSKDFPRSTPNAQAQIYAQSKGTTIYRMLDKEDRQSLPTNSKEEKTYNIKQYKAREPKKQWYEKEWLWAIAAVIMSVASLVLSLI